MGIDGVGHTLHHLGHLLICKGGNSSAVLGQTEGVEVAHECGLYLESRGSVAVEGYTTAARPVLHQFLVAKVIEHVIAILHHTVAAVNIGVARGSVGR